MAVSAQTLLDRYWSKHRMEYLWCAGLHRNDIYTDVLIDETHGYVKEGHPLCVFFRNGYNEETDWFVPIVVSETPYLPYNVPLKIPNRQFNKIRRFIAENTGILKDIADEKIRFDSDLFSIDADELIVEDRLLLLEMPNFLTHDTGLPRNIWIDTNMLYKRGKHNKRVKMFRKDIPKETISIELDDAATVRTPVPPQERSAVNVVRKWILCNLKILRDAADKKVGEKELKNNIIVFDGKGNPIEPFPTNSLLLIKRLKNGYCIVVHPRNGLFNIASDEDRNAPLSPVWFNEWYGPKRKDGEEFLIIFDEVNCYEFNFQKQRCRIISTYQSEDA